jgi:dienelactone hydrolase
VWHLRGFFIETSKFKVLRMKYLFLSLCVFPLSLFSQNKQDVFGKPPIDLVAMKNWASVSGEKISDDGKFVLYYLNNSPIGTRKLMIQETFGNWKKEIENARLADFALDSKKIIFIKGQDSLCVLELLQKETKYISNISTYKLFDQGKDEWLVFTVKGDNKQLVLKNLKTQREFRFDRANNYWFEKSSKYLIVDELLPGDSTAVVNLLDLETGIIKDILNYHLASEKPFNYSLDATRTQLAFIVEKKANPENIFELCYYNEGMDKASTLLSDSKLSINGDYKIAAIKPQFSNNGNHIFLGIKQNKATQAEFNGVKVDVWSYLDAQLQSQQLEDAKEELIYKAALNLRNKELVRLELENESIIAKGDVWVLIKKELGLRSKFESHWNSAAQISYYLVSIENGSRKLLKGNIKNYNGGLHASPNGKWIIYYDFDKGNYFSYEIASGITRNISGKCRTIWIDEENDNKQPSLPGVIEWLDSDSSLLINDSYDVWLIDPSAINPPLNLTNGFGRRNGICLEPLNLNRLFQSYSIQKKSEILLRGINKRNKERGFFRTTLGAKGDPKLLSMGPYIFGSWTKYFNGVPIKAKNANVYLVTRMSSIECQNFFITKDFQNFNKISDIQPQKEYNWLTTELKSWVLPNGRRCQGILYKPENFDSTKKYPVIFDFYERRSDELNLYIWPEPSADRINIPYFVSRGYLIFVPDIFYKMGEPGMGAVNSVVSAAKYLSRFPWVNSKRMGVQGHSWGGYEVNFLITHTNIFAAACSASGISDFISFYGSAYRAGFPMHHLEMDQGRIGGSLWKYPSLFIRNSPIFYAEKVSTPLLIMQNKGDYIVPFAQGVEFFTALRRLGKKVWLLQYDGGEHSIGGGSAEDFNTRMNQFFDHYLKEYSAPIWMTRGVSARQKGIEDGLKLDKQVKTPGPGLNVNSNVMHSD